MRLSRFRIFVAAAWITFLAPVDRGYRRCLSSKLGAAIFRALLVFGFVNLALAFSSPLGAHYSRITTCWR
jgi:hypothetical protein